MAPETPDKLLAGWMSSARWARLGGSGAAGGIAQLARNVGVAPKGPSGARPDGWATPRTHGGWRLGRVSAFKSKRWLRDWRHGGLRLPSPWPSLPPEPSLAFALRTTRPLPGAHGAAQVPAAALRDAADEGAGQLRAVRGKHDRTAWRAPLLVRMSISAGGLVRQWGGGFGLEARGTC